MKTNLACLAVVVTLWSCTATTLSTIQPKSELVNEPAIGEVKEAEVGDTLVRVAKVTQLPAIYLRKEVVAKGTGMAAGNNFTIKPGVLVARYTDPTHACYIAQEPAAVGNFMARNLMEVGICIDNRRPDWKVAIAIAPGGKAFYEPTAPVEAEHTTFIDKSAPGFWQELIYNGKSGDQLKLLYREFSNDMARPAFDQQIEYDLREGNVIGCKGARIEVVEATNIRIRYRVLAHFPQAQP